MSRVLVVEDEPKVREFISQALTQAGMTVDALPDLAELKTALSTRSYDLLVLDRLLQGRDSLHSVLELRRHAPSIKILVLSALSEVDEKVRGLSEGADDYLGKPFHVSELIARARALLRRTEGKEAGHKATELHFEDLRIDLEKQKVYREGKAVELTGKEFRLLCLLAKSPGQVFSKSMLLDQVWDMNHFPESNVVEVTIANLRSKLDHGGKALIHSRRGVGYWLGENP